MAVSAAPGLVPLSPCPLFSASSHQGSHVLTRERRGERRHLPSGVCTHCDPLSPLLHPIRILSSHPPTPVCFLSHWGQDLHGGQPCGLQLYTQAQLPPVYRRALFWSAPSAACCSYHLYFNVHCMYFSHETETERQHQQVLAPVA